MEESQYGWLFSYLKLPLSTSNLVVQVTASARAVKVDDYSDCPGETIQNTDCRLSLCSIKDT